jgi:threonine synthase
MIVPMAEFAFLKCIDPKCGGTRDLTATTFHCPKCSQLLDVVYDWSRLAVPNSPEEFASKWASRGNPLIRSGVWRFHALLPFAPPESVITIGEGQTILQAANAVGRFAGMDDGCVFLQYEGLNPSGSFKDNGMATALSHARMVGADRAACASTGNTSSSLALYCAATGLFKGIVFVGSGKISFGKLAQALDHGVRTLQIAGDFDDAMLRVQEVCNRVGIYLVNSINPFRLEGQKTVMFRVLESLDWEPPDWIVVPGGNLGNTSAFGKALHELMQIGFIHTMPRLAVINAAGADTFYQLFDKDGLRWNGGQFDATIVASHYSKLDAVNRKASSIASAIEINRPVNLPKALRALECCNGVVRSVTDQEILDAKAQVGAGGFGCEPASAASVAGLKKLRTEGVIAKSDRVVCILTGHALKDPTATVAYHSGDKNKFNEELGKRGVNHATFANTPIPVANDVEAIVQEVEGLIGKHEIT